MNDIEDSNMQKLQCPQCDYALPAQDAIGSCPQDGATLLPVYGDALIGQTWQDSYRIERCLGRGGWAAVYEARHLKLASKVAIKVLHKHLLANQGALTRFQLETKILTSLDHPNIVKVLDCGLLPRPFLILDFIPGVTLQERLRHWQDLPVEKALAIFLDIAGALAAIHDKGIIHRDLKPSNIMILPDSPPCSITAKLIDFGVARYFFETSDHVRSQELVGSLAYLSPEQVSGQPADQRSDVFSFGIIMHEVLTGTPAYNRVPTGRASAKPGQSWPPGLDDLLEMSLARNPADRFQSMHELKMQMQKIIDGTTVPVRHWPGKRSQVMATWAVACILLLGFAAFFWILPARRELDLYRQAGAAADEGDCETARRYIEQVLASTGDQRTTAMCRRFLKDRLPARPLSATAQKKRLQARTLARLQKYREAIEILQSLKGTGDEDAWLYSDLADCYLNEAQMEQAIPLLEQALKRNPDFVDAKVNLAFRYLIEGKLDQSQDLIDSILAIYPDHCSAAEMRDRLASIRQGRLPTPSRL